MIDNIEQHNRLIQRGNVVKVGGQNPREEVVRSVDVVLHLADGSDVVAPADGTTWVVPEENLSDDIREAVEAMQSQV